MTDDTRHKLILIRAIQRAATQQTWPLDVEAIATEFLEFRPHPDRAPDAALAALVEEGLREYRMAARWILGDRDSTRARRRSVFGLGSTTVPADVVTAVSGGLCRRRGGGLPRDVRARLCRYTGCARSGGRIECRFGSRARIGRPGPTCPETMGTSCGKRCVQPIPMVTAKFRLLADRSISDAAANSLVDRAAGRPAELYRLLETEGGPVYWWDAHFTLLCPLAMLKFCDYNVLGRAAFDTRLRPRHRLLRSDHRLHGRGGLRRWRVSRSDAAQCRSRFTARLWHIGKRLDGNACARARASPSRTTGRQAYGRTQDG